MLLAVEVGACIVLLLVIIYVATHDELGAAATVAQVVLVVLVAVAGIALLALVAWKVGLIGPVQEDALPNAGKG